MALPKLRESRSDERLRDTWWNGQPHDALDLPLHGRAGRRELDGGQLHLLGVRKHLFGERSRRRSVTRSIEERCARLLFEAVEPTAHRRDIEPETRARAEERALSKNGEKKANVLPVERRELVDLARRPVRASASLHCRNIPSQNAKLHCMAAKLIFGREVTG